MPPPIMQSIIRGNGHHRPALPDFRNLGTVLRILVAVNAGAALFALAREPSPARSFGGRSQVVGAAEPYLFLALAILWIASPRLAKLPYTTGAWIVILVTILAGIVVFEARRIVDPLPGSVLIVWLVWGVTAAALLLAYFHLRARALSPRLHEARLEALAARVR